MALVELIGMIVALYLMACYRGDKWERLNGESISEKGLRALLEKITQNADRAIRAYVSNSTNEQDSTSSSDEVARPNDAARSDDAAKPDGIRCSAKGNSGMPELSLMITALEQLRIKDGETVVSGLV